MLAFHPQVGRFPGYGFSCFFSTVRKYVGHSITVNSPYQESFFFFAMKILAPLHKYKIEKKIATRRCVKNREGYVLILLITSMFLET